MSQDVTLKVDLATYSSEFRLVAPDLLYFERTIRRRKAERLVDVLPGYWAFTFATIKRGQVYVCRDGVEVTDEGFLAVFVPPFSIVEWGFRPGSLTFQSFFSRHPLPAGAPAEGMVFRAPGREFPRTAAAALAMVAGATAAVPIGRRAKVSALGRRTKEVLDRTWQEDVPMAAVAAELDAGHPEMAKAFRDCYGCSPLAYRNRLRIMTALWELLTTGGRVVDMAHGVGFNDLSRFNKQFRSHINGAPSAFRGKRRKSPLIEPG